MVQNYMETLVTEMLSEELAANPHKYTDVCQCPVCLARIRAVALNNLDPFYVTTAAGEVFGEYASRENQNLSDIMASIGKGIAALAQNPAHP